MIFIILTDFFCWNDKIEYTIEVHSIWMEEEVDKLFKVIFRHFIIISKCIQSNEKRFILKFRSLNTFADISIRLKFEMVVNIMGIFEIGRQVL